MQDMIDRKAKPGLAGHGQAPRFINLGLAAPDFQPVMRNAGERPRARFSLAVIAAIHQHKTGKQAPLVEKMKLI